MKINFSRGVGGGGVFVLLCEKKRGDHQFLTNMENPGSWGGEGVLSEIPSMVGYGYFLEPHNC